MSIAGHCHDIDGDLWHEPGACPGARVNCDGKCCEAEPTSPFCEHPVPDPNNDERLHPCIHFATHEMFNTSGEWMPVCDRHGRGRGVPEDRLRPLTTPETDTGLDAAIQRLLPMAQRRDDFDTYEHFVEWIARAAREDVAQFAVARGELLALVVRWRERGHTPQCPQDSTPCEQCAKATAVESILKGLR